MVIFHIYSEHWSVHAESSDFLINISCDITLVSIFVYSIEYYNVVNASLATYSEDCVTAVHKSIEQVEILLRHMIGQRSLNVKFK